jgi:hypothetical protein
MHLGTTDMQTDRQSVEVRLLYRSSQLSLGVVKITIIIAKNRSHFVALNEFDLAVRPTRGGFVEHLSRT